MLDMLRPTVEPARPLPIDSDIETELGGNHYLFAMRGEGLAHEFFVREWAVSFRRVEECHATFDCCSDHIDGLLLFGGWTVAVAQSHASEAESGYLEIAKFALLHINLQIGSFISRCYSPYR